MKKTLLSLFAALTCMSAASAAEVTFDFTTADPDGKVYGYTPKSGTSTEYEPDGSTISEGAATITMQKLTGPNGCRFWNSSGAITFRVMSKSGITVSVAGGNISSIAFTGSALTSLSQNGTALKGASSSTWTATTPAASVSFVASKTVQIKTMTITYTPAGVNKETAVLSFPEKEYTAVMDQTFDAPRLTCNSDGEVTYSSSNQRVATVDESTGEITLEGYGTTTISATSAETNTYWEGKTQYTLIVVGKPVTARKAVAMEAGKFFLMRGEKVAVPIAADADHGYLLVEDCTVDGSEVTAPENNLFEFAKEGEGYTIKDCYGRYLFMVDKFNTLQVNAAVTPEDHYLWNVTIDADGAGSIENIGREGYTISWADKYSNFSVALSPANNLLPIMYIVGGSSSIDNINSDSVAAEEGTPIYYNLQGARVDNPSNGVYIRVINNKAEKVVL